MVAANASAHRPLTLGILLIDQFTLCELGLFVDVMRWAADEGDHSRQVNVKWSIMSARGKPVQASCGTRVSPTAALADPSELDYLVVTGGLLKSALESDEEIPKYLRRAARAGVTLVSLCPAGTFVLYKAGLMQGRRCCVGWYHYQDFLERFPGEEVLADRLFLVDGNRITCAGGSAAADLAVHLVTQHVGQAMAQKASHFLLLDRVRSAAEAQPHGPLAAVALDPRVRRALMLMEQNLARPLPVSTLARKLKLSPRQLERLFIDGPGRSPAMIYREVRMKHAAWMLNHTDRSVTDIALNSGYADCAHFTREFRRVHGFTPSRGRSRPSARAVTGELAASRLFE